MRTNSTIGFIKNLPEADYHIDSTTPHAWNFEFCSADYFTTQIVLDDCKFYREKEIINFTGTHRNGSTKLDLDSTKNNPIQTLCLTINKKKLSEYLLEELNLSSNNFYVKVLMCEDEFDELTFEEEMRNKILLFICPFKDINISNKFVYFLNDVEAFAIDEIQIKEKTNFIRECSTILWNDFYLHEYFVFSESDFRKLPNIFLTQYYITFLLSICSNSRYENSRFIIGINGYKSITFEMMENEIVKCLSKVSLQYLNELYEWIFDEQKTTDTKIAIVRNLLSLDTISKNDIFDKIEKSEQFISSCKHQYELIINESIKDHFEYFDKITFKVQEIASSIEEQINKLTHSIYSIVLSAITLIIANLSSSFDQSNILKSILTFFFVLLIVYQRWFLFIDIKKRKDAIEKQSLSYINTIQNKLRVIDKNLVEEQLNLPINSSFSRFNNNLSISKKIFDFALIILLIYMFVVASVVLWK